MVVLCRGGMEMNVVERADVSVWMDSGNICV
jgi:hypothetical protein